jgi:hypothetical protein
MHQFCGQWQLESLVSKIRLGPAYRAAAGSAFGLADNPATASIRTASGEVEVA